MIITVKELRELINVALLNEINIEDVSNVCFAPGSTHVMKTCSIGDDKYFLKFTDASLVEGVDPSLQILVEYLAYRVYSLYSGVNIPRVELVYDRKSSKVGLASSAVPGKMVGSARIDPKRLANMLTAGVYVDVFLANWDVIGTGPGNVIIDNDTATRIDPGGSMTFRAQGGRKGKAFGARPSELETMLTKGTGAGNVFQHADLKTAGKTFASVPWQKIATEIDLTNRMITKDLNTNGMSDVLQDWRSEVQYITATLKMRHKEVMAHVRYVMNER